MPPRSPRVPRSATRIYGGIALAMTTITVGVFIFRKLWGTGNKTQDEGVSKPEYPDTSYPLSIDQDARDEDKLDVSALAQSTSPLPQPVDQSAGDESQLGISVLLQAPPTTSEPAINQDATDESNPDISILAQPSTTPRQQPADRFARDEKQVSISIPSQVPPATSEPQSINQDIRDKNIPIPVLAPTTSRLYGDIGEEISSITLSQGLSNFQITETSATIIQNGGSQFTKIQRNLAWDYIATRRIALPDTNDNLKKKHVLTQAIIALPRSEAVFNGYHKKKKIEPCFKGTRVALLREIADCVTDSSKSRMYILSGPSGIGKSSVAYTIASRAADLNLLGASFCFSRDEADHNNAKRFFTTIAHHLCIYNETFAKAIGDALKSEHATTQNLQLQLSLLILDPLRRIVQSGSRPILIVVDALDECDEQEAVSVLAGLIQLVQVLPPFRVILTMRPQPYFDHFWSIQDIYKLVHLQDIANKVDDGDVRLYLEHSLSMQQVQKCFPVQQWCASDEEINSLVSAAGRFFIIASTAVRYILDKRASNPAARMQNLLRAFAQDHTRFSNPDRFYTLILEDVVPVNCDDDDIVSRYQTIVGAIIFVQRPLPVSTLAHLIGIDAEEIHEVLDKLQSVILLGDDSVPRIYHQSFPEYLTDEARCKGPHLRINPRARAYHTQIAIRCFEIMNKHLKYNILGLGDPARFMNNEYGLEEDGITDEQMQEKIPQQLRYACVYWDNHLEGANIEDSNLMNRLARFVDEHMLHWFEVLSLIGNLDSAHRTIRIVLKLVKSTSSDLHQLLSDALRLITEFYEIIKQSALHTYYSALPFAPTDSLLYRRYIQEAVHNVCAVEGAGEKWSSLVANLSHEGPVRVIRFSLDSTLFVSWYLNDRGGKLKIWDATTGTPISTIPWASNNFAVANDLSMVASFQHDTAMLYNMNGSLRAPTFTTSSSIEALALSSESSRVVAALYDGTVWLWNSRNAEVIDSFDGFSGSHGQHKLQFSFTGTRLAYTSVNGIVKLRDGISGGFIADLRCGSDQSSYKFQFSGDGSRIASLSHPGGLTLWDSENGGLIAAVTDDCGRNGWAISANGSLLATIDRNKVTLWSGNNGLAQIKVLEVHSPQSMAFSLDNILAITTSYDIKFYNVKTPSFQFISGIRFGGMLFHVVLAFSPNETRFAFGESHGRVSLWDTRDIDASSPSEGGATAVSAILSRDCLRMARGLEDGTVELWGTSPTKRQIASHQVHKRPVKALAFGPDGGLLASGSDDGTIKLWNGKDGFLRGTLEAPSGSLTVALSNSLLVAAGNCGVTLWSLDTLSLIHNVSESRYEASSVSIAENNALIAVAHRRGVSLLDARKHRTIATFDVPDRIHKMTFLPDNLQLVAQSKAGAFLSFNLINKHLKKGATLEHLIQLPDTSFWHGVPIWYRRGNEHWQRYLLASFPQHKRPVPVLWIPSDLPVTGYIQGSSMIVLHCKDGRIILLRLPANHAG